MRARGGKGVTLLSAMIGLAVLVASIVAFKETFLEHLYLYRLSSEDSEERQGVVEWLGEFRSARAVPYLVDILKEGATPITLKVASVEALGKIGIPSREAVPELIRMVEDEHLGRPAAKVLSRIGLAEASSIIALAKLLDHDSPEVRERATRLLQKADLPEITYLTATLNHREWPLRLRAATHLGNMGPEATAAIPALRNSLKDDKGAVIQAAFEALKKIEDS